VFDALTSERPHKKAWSVDDALALIEGEAGKSFDPALVPHFLALRPEVERIMLTFRDSLTV
jgi:putative two-component system response regulator